ERPADEPHRAGARAVLRERLLPRPNDLGDVAETGVVVRREDENASSPLHRGPRRLRAVEIVEALVDPRLPERVQLGGEPRVEGAPAEPAQDGVPGSGTWGPAPGRPRNAVACWSRNSKCRGSSGFRRYSLMYLTCIPSHSFQQAAQTFVRIICPAGPGSGARGRPGA